MRIAQDHCVTRARANASAASTWPASKRVRSTFTARAECHHTSHGLRRTSVKKRGHQRLSLAAARSTISRRSASARLLARNTSARTDSDAETGDPLLKGAAGSYSIASRIVCAVSAPNNSCASTSPKSIPAVTPASVIRLRSRPTRSETASAPKSGSSSRDIQCVVAR